MINEIKFLQEVAKIIGVSIITYTYSSKTSSCIGIKTTSNVTMQVFFAAFLDVISNIDLTSEEIIDIKNMILDMHVMQHVRNHIFYWPNIKYEGD